MVFRILKVILASALLAVLYNNCAGSGSGSDENASQSSGCGESLPASLKDPQTIDQVTHLIQALPKPLSLDCFILALKRPLKVYAVNNGFSAQPSQGPGSPRIFLINGTFILSVVPAGPGKYLLEMSQRTSSTSSVKAEVLFPVSGGISMDAPYSRILETSGGTSCRVCHNNEGRFAAITSGEAYTSNILTPDPLRRITQGFLLNQALSCNSAADPYRCQMLKAVFVDGQAQDTAFP